VGLGVKLLEHPGVDVLKGEEKRNGCRQRRRRRTAVKT